MKRRDREAVLKYDPKVYETQALKTGSLTYDQQVKEYNRLRGIANARLERFEKAKDLNIRKADAYKQNVGRYRLPASQLTERQLANSLNEVSRFLTARGGSVRGQQQIRNQAIESLHISGYTWINKSNFYEFVDFMEETRARADGKLAPSDVVVDVMKEAYRLNTPLKDVQKNLSTWIKNIDKIKTLTGIKGKAMSSADVLSKLTD